MPNPVIRVENLSKRYRLGATRHDTLRDRIVHGAASLIHRRKESHSADEFWALRDASFEVQRGEVLGIIGRNGAGKSTLLKILSRITEPTTGRISIQGRVASLLEVGTGFHPELTGRENIFLNGAILGMSRIEIRHKFDEIVAFAEVERFLDTAVKHYSSGMYVRLAFAVAAHLEPEILIVDEVLAVGDVEFQQKCLGKMRSVAACDGRTVLFVSHNMGALQALCSRGLYLRNGQVAGHSDIQSQLAAYSAATLALRENGSFRVRQIAAELRLSAFSFDPNPVPSGGTLRFCVELAAEPAVTISELCILIYSRMGTRVAILDLRNSRNTYRAESGRAVRLEGTVRNVPLVPADYIVGLYVNSTVFKGDILDIAALTIVRAAEQQSITPYAAHDSGYVQLDYQFEQKRPSH
jgi:lipopolysaccharide transport system ATP-binding protein